ncbi:MAG: hypothetical protein FWD27_00820 [Coriobacteriia bacterium]|nr:hypothetical protein [Coriobacteriia bacterium]
METNETILTRDVVVLESQKKLGSVKALRVNSDTMTVCHYIINNDSTGSILVLPFEKALSVGDTFMMVQSRDDFLAANDAFSNKVLQEGYVLLKEEVFSKTGNKLSPVQGFEFDTVSGGVTKLQLESGQSYSSDSFLFFSSDFVFVDDGTPTAIDLRGVTGESPVVAAPAAFGAGVMAASTEVPEAPAPVVAEEPVVVAAPAEEPVVVAPPAEEETTVSDEEIMGFLEGAVLQSDVESENGVFKVSKGTVLTKEIILEAAEHDAVLLLTINAEV